MAQKMAAHVGGCEWCSDGCPAPGSPLLPLQATGSSHSPHLQAAGSSLPPPLQALLIASTARVSRPR
ncbi:hypothetical protein TNCV_3266521 [Trichonephila clavipes]|nr:hypothetical protein TNCV_3266521 [Trichonephila clavipes]